jgi:hypothetical protein
MSTIVYRAGVMASDSRAYGGGRAPVGTKAKIHRLPDGSLIGVSTTVPGQGEALALWVANGADPAKPPPGITDVKATILLVRPNGEVFYADDSLYFSGPLAGPYWAIGSGGEFALGAMEMGADPERAVEVAIKLDPWSDGAVDVLHL